MASIVPRTGALSLFLLLGGAFGWPLVSAADAPTAPAETPAEEDLIALLRKADHWDRVAETETDQAASGKRIRARALAAEQLLAERASSKEAFAALEERVRRRSLRRCRLTGK